MTIQIRLFYQKYQWFSYQMTFIKQNKTLIFLELAGFWNYGEGIVCGPVVLSFSYFNLSSPKKSSLTTYAKSGIHLKDFPGNTHYSFISYHSTSS
jgi:hypothetical protein